MTDRDAATADACVTDPLPVVAREQKAPEAHPVGNLNRAACSEAAL